MNYEKRLWKCKWKEIQWKGYGVRKQKTKRGN